MALEVVGTPAVRRRAGPACRTTRPRAIPARPERLLELREVSPDMVEDPVEQHADAAAWRRRSARRGPLVAEPGVDPPGGRPCRSRASRTRRPGPRASPLQPRSTRCRATPRAPSAAGRRGPGGQRLGSAPGGPAGTRATRWRAGPSRPCRHPARRANSADQTLGRGLLELALGPLRLAQGFGWHLSASSSSSLFLTACAPWASSSQSSETPGPRGRAGAGRQQQQPGCGRRPTSSAAFCCRFSSTPALTGRGVEVEAELRRRRRELRHVPLGPPGQVPGHVEDLVVGLVPVRHAEQHAVRARSPTGAAPRSPGPASCLASCRASFACGRGAATSSAAASRSPVRKPSSSGAADGPRRRREPLDLGRGGLEQRLLRDRVPLGDGQLVRRAPPPSGSSPAAFPVAVVEGQEHDARPDAADPQPGLDPAARGADLAAGRPRPAGRPASCADISTQTSGAAPAAAAPGRSWCGCGSGRASAGGQQEREARRSAARAAAGTRPP